ncbi:hypothetical protein ACQY0O_000438 [Thecaphora frezii]
MKAALLSTLSLALASSLGLVRASSSPVLAFASSQASSGLLPNVTPSSLDAFTSKLFASGSQSAACGLDALVLVSTDGLDRSTFTSLRHVSPSLRQRALAAPAQLTFEQTVREAAAPERGLERLLERACGGEAQVVHIKAGQRFKGGDLGGKLFIRLDVEDLKAQEESLLETLSEIDEAYPRNLVIIAASGAAGHRLSKRQYATFGASFADDNKGNWTEPEGSIFERYQLFSTAQILVLLIVVGVLIPTLFIVIGQLAGVQVPDQIGVRKDPITGDKKNQ